MVAPTHTDDGPLSVPAFTAAFTVIAFVALATLHPVTVYVIVTLPAATPVTTPLLLTVALPVLLLLHTPPDVPLLLSVIVDPVHTDVEPFNVPAVTVPGTVTDFGALDTGPL